MGAGASIATGYNNIDGLRRYAAELGIPWGIQEWGPSWDSTSDRPCPTSSSNPNNPYYVDGLWDYFNQHSSTLALEIFFNNTINGCPPLGEGRRCKNTRSSTRYRMR